MKVLCAVHELDLPTALELGRHLGLQMPRSVVIFGIQAQDARTFGQSLSGSVEIGMERAVEMVLVELSSPGLP